MGGGEGKEMGEREGVEGSDSFSSMTMERC